MTQKWVRADTDRQMSTMIIEKMLEEYSTKILDIYLKLKPIKSCFQKTFHTDGQADIWNYRVCFATKNIMIQRINQINYVTFCWWIVNP